MSLKKVDMNALSLAVDDWFKAWMRDELVISPEAKIQDGTQDEAVMAACATVLTSQGWVLTWN